MNRLHDFWTWWRDQMLGLLPGHDARLRDRADDGLILSDAQLGPDATGGEGSISAVERLGGVERKLGPVRLAVPNTEPIRAAASRNRLPLVLALPGTLLLEREVTLPLAAERDLGRVLFHEMDRVTPFSAPEVLWTHSLRARDRAEGRLVVRLSLVQKALLDPLIDGLALAGLPIGWLELPGPDGQRRRLSVDPSENRPTSRRGLMVPALAGLAVLLIIALTLPFVLQGEARAEVERQIAADAPVVSRVQQLRRAAAANETGTDVVAAERRRAGDALEAIALLTDALPDDTYLTGLTFEGGRLTLDGQSRSAAALIAPLTSNQRVQDATFTAPVVRNTVGLDTFSMRLRITR